MGITHAPAPQLVGPLTCGRLVQSLVHEPQVWMSAGDAQVPGAPQVS